MSNWRNDLVTAYRDHGLRVHLGAGWGSFGVGDWADDDRPHAALKHQFVWPPQNSDQGAVDMLTMGYSTGQYFLRPPVANNFLGKSDDGDVYMIAGRVAQHAGRGVRAVYDRARRDLPPAGDGQNTNAPDDWDGGSFVYWGTEMHHYDAEPFHQYDALLRMSVAECQVFGWSANRILEHSNATTRKRSDLQALDGNQLRRDIAAALAGGSNHATGNATEWDKTMTEEQLRSIVRSELAAFGADPNYSIKDARTLLSMDTGAGLSLAGELAAQRALLQGLTAAVAALTRPPESGR